MKEVISGEETLPDKGVTTASGIGNGHGDGNQGRRSLQELLPGEVTWPGDPGYEAGRKSWNARFDRRPALIVKCRTTDDVARAVTAARQQGISLALRSGGHSPAGFSTIDGGMLLDMSSMNELTVDAGRRVATVQPGLTWGEYTAQTIPYGLATPAGDTASVGVGGLTLGGGIGWLVRKYGMTIDHLLAAEVVTADGEVVTTSESERPDLFWALRGGGGNFGIVTRFEFRLVPVDTVLAGMLVYPAEPAVLAAFARAALQAPDELTTISEVMKTPPIPFLPAELYGKVHFQATFCYAGDPSEGEKVIETLSSSVGPVLGQMVMPMPYPGIFKFSEEASISRPFSVRNRFLKGLDEDTAAIIIEHAQRGTSPFSFAQIRVLGGALARVSDDATAFAHRQAPVLATIINGWEEAHPEQEQRHRAWTEELWRALEPKAVGAYANFQGDEGQECVKQVYPGPTYERLARIKACYDPTNFFRANCNIGE